VTGFTLRGAEAADVGDVFRLVRGLADYERLLDRFTATEADYIRMLFGPKPLGQALLAEVEARPVGVAVWFYALNTFTARPILFLEDLFVEPAYRRHGIGLAFFRRLARIACENGCVSMNWNVLGWNEPAIAFYRRLGAEPVKDWNGQRLDAAGLRALADGA
jgi:GNAT superfamily N-acetyltransferase